MSRPTETEKKEMTITDEQAREIARLVDEAVQAGTYGGTQTTLGAIVIALKPYKG